jgi:carbonic anhydrase
MSSVSSAVGGVPPRYGAAPAASRPKLAVVACMDPRLRLEAALGVAQSQAAFIRNAGGVITDETLYTLRAAYDVFGAREFVVVGHNDCAFARNGSGQWDTTGVETVRAQVQRLRLWSGLPRDVTVRGFVYSLATGRVSEVDPQQALASAAPAARPALPDVPAVIRPAALPQKGKPAAVASTAETRRVGGRLQRQRLERIPPAESAMPRTGPSRDDFRRKVEAMAAGEASALGTLDSPPEAPAADARPTAPALRLTARDFVRALIVGEALKAPPSRRNDRPDD